MHHCVAGSFVCLHLRLPVVFLLRCYWRGKVTFSDGASGTMAFSSCERTSRPHAQYLAELDGSADPSSNPTHSTPLHYIHGLIRDFSSGAEIIIEPREFQNFRQRNMELHGHHRSLDELDVSVVYPFFSELADHYAYNAKDLAVANNASSHRCGVGSDHEHSIDDHHDEHGHHEHGDNEAHGTRRLFDSSAEAWKQKIRSLASVDIQVQRRQLQAKRYLELQISNDNLRTTALGANTGDDSLAIANQMALYYGDAAEAAGFNSNSTF